MEKENSIGDKVKLDDMLEKYWVPQKVKYRFTTWHNFNRNVFKRKITTQSHKLCILKQY